VRRLLESSARVHHIVTEDSAAIPRALAAFADEGVGIVAINGGDGSVAHVLTTLMHASPFAAAPLLCALPGGTTNVTVGDVGIRGGLCDANPEAAGLDAQRQRPRSDRAAPRHRREAPPAVRRSAAAWCFGAGAVVDGIEYWQEQVRARGMRSELSSGVAMVRTLWGMVHGHDGFGEALRIGITPPRRGAQRRRVHAAGHQRRWSACFSHTPLLGRRRRASVFTAIERHAAHFARSLPSLLRGRATAFMSRENGYHSARLESVQLDFRSAFTLDGELHHPAPADAPLRVGCAGTARFLRI